MTTATRHHASDLTSGAIHGLSLVPAGPALRRVVAPGGRVIGHLRTGDPSEGPEHIVLRFAPETRRFREVGRFWSLDQALECLRLSR